MMTETSADPRLTYEDIDPEIAEVYLRRNLEHNRNIIPQKLEALTRDMSAGRWRVTTETIKFSTEGRLIDGQHRLMAIMRSKKTVRILVARDVDPSAVYVIDTNAPRSTAQALHIAESGMRNLSVMVAAAQMLHGYDSGLLEHTGSTIGSVDRMTSSEAQAYVLENAEALTQATEVARRCYSNNLRIPTSTIAVAYMILKRVDDEDAEVFFYRIIDGRSDGVGDPLHTLTKRVSDDRFAGRKISPATGLFYILRAWNAYRDNETTVKFQAGVGGTRRTAMPVPH